MLALIFLVAALVLFVLAAIPIASTRVSLGWLGAACVVAAFLCDRLGAS